MGQNSKILGGQFSAKLTNGDRTSRSVNPDLNQSSPHPRVRRAGLNREEALQPRHRRDVPLLVEGARRRHDDGHGDGRHDAAPQLSRRRRRDERDRRRPDGGGRPAGRVAGGGGRGEGEESKPVLLRRAGVTSPAKWVLTVDAALHTQCRNRS